MKTNFEINGYSFVIPPRMVGAIERYVYDHIRPGNFLQSIISNDLTEAILRADDENFKQIPAFVAYFYNEAPSQCWGNQEKMEAWIK